MFRGVPGTPNSISLNPTTATRFLRATFPVEKKNSTGDDESLLVSNGLPLKLQWSIINIGDHQSVRRHTFKFHACILLP